MCLASLRRSSFCTLRQEELIIARESETQIPLKMDKMLKIDHVLNYIKNKKKQNRINE